MSKSKITDGQIATFIALNEFNVRLNNLYELIETFLGDESFSDDARRLEIAIEQIMLLSGEYKELFIKAEKEILNNIGVVKK